jgi:hypothetical protein
MTNRPSVVLVEFSRLAHLVPADSGNESPDRCKKELFITSAHQSTEYADEDQHEGNDKGLRAHGLGRFQFRPLLLEVAGKHLLASDGATRIALDRHSQFRRRLLVAISDVL